MSAEAGYTQRAMWSSGSVDASVHDHIVNFYDDDDDLVRDLGSYTGAGLLAGERMVVIATAAHRDALAAHLKMRDLDVAGLRAGGLYLAFDARETLDLFMVDGSPDPLRFEAVLDPIMHAAVHDGVAVRAFGEMVAILWDEGNVTAAIDLECLWNNLGQRFTFTLYCAYSAAALASTSDLDAAGLVCANHSELIAPRSYRSRNSARTAFEDGRAAEVFAPTRDAIAAARHFVAAALEALAQPHLVDDAVVVTSELVTNALHHADGPFRVTVVREESAVRVGVEDRNPAEPVRRRPSKDVANGRGMSIVDRIASVWGVDSHPKGKVVWAALPSG